MTRPKDREESGKASAESGFDDVWGELVDAASSTPKSDSSEPTGEATKEWTEGVRGERARADGASPNEGSASEEDGAPQVVPAKSDKTKAWTEEVRAERKRADAKGAPAAEKKAEPTAATSGAFVLGPLPGKADAEADATMDALMKASAAAAATDDASEPDESEASSSAENSSGASKSSAESNAASGAMTASTSAPDHEIDPPDAPSVAAAVPVNEDAAEVIALRTESAPPLDDEPLTEPAPGSSKLAVGLVLAAIVAVGAYLWMGSGNQQPPGDKQKPAAVAAAKSKAPVDDADAPPPPAHTPARPPAAKPDAPKKPPVADPPKPPKPTTDDVDADPPKPPVADPPKPPVADPPKAPDAAIVPPVAKTGDPREPPPGTPDDIAAVFRKLPVSPADRPPVGGVGASGIHIDAIAMGSTVDRARCKGESTDFSIGRGDEVNVCLRVVHPRVKEEVVVLWQKDGGTRRRGKVVVKPAHAYRTRAYLKLRSEYVGRWTVKILAGDVVLASHEFNVVD